MIHSDAHSLAIRLSTTQFKTVRTVASAKYSGFMCRHKTSLTVHLVTTPRKAVANLYMYRGCFKQQRHLADDKYCYNERDASATSKLIRKSSDSRWQKLNWFIEWILDNTTWKIVAREMNTCDLKRPNKHRDMPTATHRTTEVFSAELASPTKD